MFELTLASRTTAFSVPTPVFTVPPWKVTVPAKVDTPTVCTLPPMWMSSVTVTLDSCVSPITLSALSPGSVIPIPRPSLT